MCCAAEQPVHVPEDEVSIILAQRNGVARGQFSQSPVLGAREVTAVTHRSRICHKACCHILGQIPAQATFAKRPLTILHSHSPRRQPVAGNDGER